MTSNEHCVWLCFLTRWDKQVEFFSKFDSTIHRLLEGRVHRQGTLQRCNVHLCDHRPTMRQYWWWWLVIKVVSDEWTNDRMWVCEYSRYARYCTLSILLAGWKFELFEELGYDCMWWCSVMNFGQKWFLWRHSFIVWCCEVDDDVDDDDDDVRESLLDDVNSFRRAICLAVNVRPYF